MLNGANLLEFSALIFNKILKQLWELKLPVTFFAIFSAILIFADLGITPYATLLESTLLLYFILLLRIIFQLIKINFKYHLSLSEIKIIILKTLADKLKKRSFVAIIVFLPLSFLFILPKFFMLICSIPFALVWRYRWFIKSKLYDQEKAHCLQQRYFGIINKLVYFENKSGRQILVIRSGGLGDILMAFPMLLGLKEKYKNYRITFASDYSFKEIILLNENVDKWISLHSPLDFIVEMSKSFKIVNLQGIIERSNDTPGQDAFCSFAGVNPSTMFTSIYLTNEIQNGAKEILNSFNIEFQDKLVGIQIKSATPSRSWIFSKVEEYSHLIASMGYKVVLLGDDPTYGFAGNNIINAIGKTTLIESAAIIKRCSLVVCPDSGLLHLASALNVPTIGIFGVIDPKLRTAYYPNCVSLNAHIECSPCNDHSVPPNCFSTPIYRCMHEISVSDVLEASTTLLAQQH